MPCNRMSKVMQTHFGERIVCRVCTYLSGDLCLIERLRTASLTGSKCCRFFNKSPFIQPL